ncbi:hypothetical protein IP85_21250 [Rhizobium sp. AAP116]|nr:hypothetical protein IP85_21250 [Rhizobium sp. AAP116]
MRRSKATDARVGADGEIDFDFHRARAAVLRRKAIAAFWHKLLRGAVSSLVGALSTLRTMFAPRRSSEYSERIEG